MDRIALISDIHGNVPALEAVLLDIERRGIARVVCLGDLVGKGPHPDRVVDVCRTACETIVRGNWDDALATTDTDNPTLVWQQQRLGPARLAFLRGLPNTVDLVMSGKRVRLFHASQKSVHYRVRETDPAATLLAMFDDTEFTGHAGLPDVVGYGDIHRGYLLNFPLKTLFNVGSVGNPHDTPQATYAVLEGVLGSEAAAPFAIDLVRVPYDIEGAIRQAEAEAMPGREAYAEELRTARYRGPQEYAREREALQRAHGLIE